MTLISNEGLQIEFEILPIGINEICELPPPIFAAAAVVVLILCLLFEVFARCFAVFVAHQFWLCYRESLF